MRQPSGRSAAQPQEGGSASCDDWQVFNEAGGTLQGHGRSIEQWPRGL